MKEIEMIKLNKIKKCLLRIFELEDNAEIDENNTTCFADYHDYLSYLANNRALKRYLKDYSTNLQEELLNNIQWQNDNCVEVLEKLGWKVIREKK